MTYLIYPSKLISTEIVVADSCVWRGKNFDTKHIVVYVALPGVR